VAHSELDIDAIVAEFVDATSEELIEQASKLREAAKAFDRLVNMPFASGYEIAEVIQSASEMRQIATHLEKLAGTESKEQWGCFSSFRHISPTSVGLFYIRPLSSASILLPCSSAPALSPNFS
jgi:hypothetical protein